MLLLLLLLLLTLQYTRNNVNVVKEDKELTDVRRKLFEHMKHKPLNVILCRKVLLINVSDADACAVEVLPHWHIDRVSASLLLRPCLQARAALPLRGLCQKGPKPIEEFFVKIKEESSRQFPNTCIIHSVIAANTTIDPSFELARSAASYIERSVVEFSNLAANTTVGPQSIVSYVETGINCKIPASVIVQTVPLSIGFVTFAFGLLLIVVWR